MVREGEGRKQKEAVWAVGRGAGIELNVVFTVNSKPRTELFLCCVDPANAHKD
jgi:hypothetical protein